MDFTYFSHNDDSIGTDNEYTETNVLLDACGRWIGDPYQMGYSKKEIEDNKHYIDLPPRK